MNPTVRLALRLIVLALLTVVVQESAVSQISIFGISADLTPLVVMSVGLLAGSMAGAVMGFGTGLLVDTVLVQTLGRHLAAVHRDRLLGRVACARRAIPPTAWSRWPPGRSPPRWPGSG